MVSDGVAICRAGFSGAVDQSVLGSGPMRVVDAVRVM